MKKNIPNIITLLNLFCGCCALVCIFYGRVNWVIYWLILAGFADFLDGMVARMLQVHSPLGKELDSLADMVSFGVVPGAMLFAMLGGTTIEGDLTSNWVAFTGFIVSAFSCLRLARFNLDTRQTEDFIGLNTPSATMFVSGLYLIYQYDSFGFGHIVSNPYYLVPVILILSYLLNSEFRMFSFKFKKGWKGNEFRFALIAAAFIELILFKEAAFAPIIMTYFVLSFLDTKMNDK